MERINNITRRIVLISGIILFYAVHGVAADADRVVVSIKRNYAVPANELATLVIDWNELATRLTSLRNSNLKITDQHFGLPLPFTIVDENADGKADKILVTFTFKSNEPVWTFLVTSDGKGGDILSVDVPPFDPKWEISYLVPFVNNPGAKTKGVGDRLVESTMHTYPDVKDLSIISPGKWTYEYGFFLNGAFKLGEKTKNKAYQTYCKQWVDNFITDGGQWKDGAYNMKEYRLDDILPGRLCISLYKQTGQEKYKKIADQFIVQLNQQPKTSEGGYWHKEIYPNQMWLDGIYMGDVFSTQYAATFKDPHWFDEAAVQIKLMYKHAYDPATGVLFHGWDESKNKVWADQEKGNSPELWSRAIGWYAMALIECLDYLPQEHPERKNIQSIFQKLCASIRNFQDKKTGLWFQIINKGNLADNWIETSSSAMFTYAFAKGVNQHLLDKTFLASSEKAFAALLSNYLYTDSKGDVHLDQGVKVGSLNIKNSKGDYAYYISSERRLDDYKGLAALLYASIELNK